MDASAKSDGSLSKTLAIIIVVALLALVFTIDAKRRAAEAQLKQLSMKVEQLTKSPQENVEEAKAIVDKVKKIFLIPDGVDPTVATIVKIEELRKQNPFYNKAKNGDHLVVTSDRGMCGGYNAILYDPVANRIIDVVPVQIQPTGQQGAPQQGQPAAQQPTQQKPAAQTSSAGQ